MSKPTISVIMGIYNCERTLGEAIESILAQTYHNWEMVICDDGSSDHTYEIADQYRNRFPEKIVLLKNETNMGLNFTLNKCLEIARGNYIARMDGDDISLPERFERELSFLEANPQYVLVSVEMEMFDDTGVWGKTTVIPEPTVNDFCMHTPFFLHAGVMIKADILREVGGYTVDPRLLRVEDCHLWFKIYAAGYRGANLQEVLYQMRNDRNASVRRTWAARKNGMYVMRIGFKMVNMPWYKYIYLLRNDILELIKCVLPVSLYEIVYKRKYGESIASS